MPLLPNNDQLHTSDTGACRRVAPTLATRVWRPALEAAPTTAAAALTCALAWRERGSVAAPDWLGAGLVLVLLLATVTLAGAPRRPSPSALLGLAGLLALAAWAALSAAWAPLPSLARDEGLLTCLYAVVLALPLLTLHTPLGRLWALGGVVAVLGATALATAIRVGWGADPVAAYAGSGRLFFPIGYVNAQASFALVAFWPALLLASRRAARPVLRAFALAAATAMLGVGTLTQSRGAVVALVASGVVVLAALPSRLRLAVSAAMPLALVAAGFRRLTEPFEAQFDSRAALAASIPPAGQTVVWITLVAVAAGLLYALLDRRLSIASRPRLLLGRAVALLVVAAVAVGVFAVFHQVDAPRQTLEERWEAFKHEPTTEAAGTHFLSPGSNRYDFWRVALNEFGDDPVVGGGARSFGPVYLQERESPETPTRVHSLFLEVLAEQGLVGGLLLALSLGAMLFALLRRRACPAEGAALAAAAFWLTHAAVDWTWTFPVVGIPFFLILGIGCAASGSQLGRRSGIGAGAAALLVAVLAFAPPWLGARYVDAARAHGLPAASGDLRRARRLDPLSTEPYFVEAELAVTPSARVTALRGAARKEPDSVRAQYQLGLALLADGRKSEARVALERARALFPDEPAIAEALRRTR